MANEQSGVKFFIILSILLGTLGPCLCNDDDDGSPIIDAIQAFMKESSKSQSNGGGLGVLGPMLQGLMQGGGGKNIGDFIAAATGKKSSTMNLLAGLGSILQARKESKNEEGGFDPAILGTMLDLFSSMSQSDESQKKPKGNEIDWGSMLSLVGNAMSSGDEKSSDSNNNNAGFETIMSFLPVIMSSISGRHHPHSSGNVKHHDHVPFLPPILENIHEYWDHFTSSQFGRALWENSGLSALAAMFHDENGNFDIQRSFDSLENNALRRRWIKGIAVFISEWANHIADGENQKSYLETVQVLTNSFLQSQGYSKNARLDFKNAGESLSAVTNEVFKRQLQMKVNSGEYIKPAVNYLKHIFGATKKSGLLSGLQAETVESKLRETLESQVIDPILRANRAYKFAIEHKECAKYVVCVIGNNGVDNDGIKPAVIKATNLATAWFLSTPTDVAFFELAGSTGADDCEIYNQNCSEFLDVDTKATTEYFHNEL